MMEQLFNYPEYAEIDGESYKINTDYRVAIKCNDISLKNDISDEEKALAIIYLLFGDKGLEDRNHYEQLLEKANYFLKCGNIEEKQSEEELDMDFIQDFPYIEASFMSDYGMSIKDKNLHWWEFYYLLCGLSQSSFGNSCILNRIRDLRNLDLNKINDPKEREKLRKAKEQFALKKNKKIKKDFTQEEVNAMDEYHKLVGD